MKKIVIVGSREFGQGLEPKFTRRGIDVGVLVARDSLESVKQFTLRHSETRVVVLEKEMFPNLRTAFEKLEELDLQTLLVARLPQGREVDSEAAEVRYQKMGATGCILRPTGDATQFLEPVLVAACQLAEIDLPDPSVSETLAKGSAMPKIPSFMALSTAPPAVSPQLSAEHLPSPAPSSGISPDSVTVFLEQERARLQQFRADFDRKLQELERAEGDLLAFRNQIDEMIDYFRKARKLLAPSTRQARHTQSQPEPLTVPTGSLADDHEENKGSQFPVTLGTKTFHVSQQERHILELLLAANGGVVPRKQFLNGDGGLTSEGVFYGVLSHIKQLLAEEFPEATHSIENVWGKGYRLNKQLLVS